MTAREELAQSIATNLDRMFGKCEFGPATQDYELADALLAEGWGKLAEVCAAELEDAAESIYRQARVQLRSSDGSRWQLAHRSGYADGVILARQELRDRAAAIRSQP